MSTEDLPDFEPMRPRRGRRFRYRHVAQRRQARRLIAAAYRTPMDEVS